MRVGAPVIVTHPESTFRGCRGVIVSDRPAFMVQLEGEAKPMRFGAIEIAPASSPEHITGGG
jgi:hypothetical protein